MANRRKIIWQIKIFRLLIVLGGIVAGQFVLYGPSLMGQKVLLPLDILAQPSVYLPGDPVRPHDAVLSDLVEVWEPGRQFAVAEFRAGRWPMWNPYQYAGCPVVWPKLSPFLLLETCTKSPVILAWTQLLVSLVAGLGLYAFLRCTLRISFWAATLPAWCYPATGFFIFWQGFPEPGPVYWLPWLLLAVDRTVRGGHRFAPLGLSIVSGLVLVSGTLDIAGQVLLVSGLYALWRLGETHLAHRSLKNTGRAAAVLSGCWALGFLLSAPYHLPLLEYARTGMRMQQRALGSEERPPVGLPALPQVVLPDLYGATRLGSLWINKREGNQVESLAAAYAGLLATLFIAPLAWCSRRHRSASLFLTLLGLFGLSWCLNVPGVVTLLRLPGLNMMSHNRLTFASSLAFLALAGVGLDALRRHKIRAGTRWLWLPTGCVAGLFCWCFQRTLNPPEPIATWLETAVAQHKSIRWIHTFDDVRQVLEWFNLHDRAALALCGAALACWLLLLLRPRWPGWSVSVLGLLMLTDIWWFAHDRNAQCDPALFYPPIPALEQLKQAAPGRVLGIRCLPSALSQTQGLRDIRGYDAIDPARLMDLLSLAKAPDYQGFSYTYSQWYQPSGSISARTGANLPPILDMLGVRYLIYRGTPPPDIRPVCQSQDYWVVANERALPRAFIPKRVEVEPDAVKRLQKLAAPQFDAREVAYVEEPLNLPDGAEGQVRLTAEIPTRISLSAQMTTPGLVVLADLWDKGWAAYLNGRRVPILRANHAIRGVVVPAGTSALEFRYEPASYLHGLELAGLAGAILLVWLGLILGKRPQTGSFPVGAKHVTP